MSVGSWVSLSVLVLCSPGSAATQSPDTGAMARGGAPVVDGGPELAIALEGTVLDPAGAPASGVVVTSSAGGSTLTDEHGRYRLEVGVPLEAETIQIVAQMRGAGLQGQVLLDVSSASGRVPVGSLRLGLPGSCVPAWLPTFGFEPGTDDTILDLCVFDDGNGTALYVAGRFWFAGNRGANAVARWDGEEWRALDSGVAGGGAFVTALAVFDDGNGPALYAGGEFTSASGVPASRIARWDGTSWSALGSGMNGPVEALAVHDDGSGPALYAGGSFTTAGGVAANRVARWDGTSWSALGSGTDASVWCLASFDDGGGPALYAGGTFTTAGGVAASRIARWDGSAWTPLGAGLAPPPGIAPQPSAATLAVHDDGSGTALYVGGVFETAGGVSASSLARWDGTSWSSVGGGVDGRVYALTVLDDGHGPVLCAGGSFYSAGGIPAGNVARWDGTSWSGVGSGVLGTVWSAAAYDEGHGPALFVGGSFSFAGDKRVRRIARLEDGDWTTLGEGLSGSPTSVEDVTVHDDGGGIALYVAGSFDTVGGQRVEGVARWDGLHWSALGAGFDEATSLQVYDDGGGAALYAGVGTPDLGVKRWTGSDWQGLGLDWLNARELAVFDDGTGAKLFASGTGHTGAPYLLKWLGGTSWASIASIAPIVMTTFDDGGGNALYVGGGGMSIAGLNNIARYDGSTWTPLGSGVNQAVWAMAVFDDGNGPALYVGGDFTTAGGAPASRVARWNGTSWSALGSGTNGRVLAMAVHDDGSGPALYVGGDFTTAGGSGARKIARWDGSSWSPVGSGVGPQGFISALGSLDGPAGSHALIAGGSFPRMGDSEDSHLALWGCDTTGPRIAGPSVVVVQEAVGSPPGEIVTFEVTAQDAHDPAPSLVVTPPPGASSRAAPRWCTARQPTRPETCPPASSR